MPSTIAQATPAHFTSPPSPSIYRLLLVKLSSSTTAIATKATDELFSVLTRYTYVRKETFFSIRMLFLFWILCFK